MAALVFDPNSLDVGEMIAMEEVAGEGCLIQLSEGKPSAKLIGAIVWILNRRDNPDFTLEDAYKVKVADIDFEVPDAEGG